MGLHPCTRNALLLIEKIMQRGVEDPGYVPGPYSTVEGDVSAFVAWYISRISAHLSA